MNIWKWLFGRKKPAYGFRSFKIDGKTSNQAKPICDWQGNEIKEGMTIYYVKTRIHHNMLGVMMPEGYLKILQKEYSEDCWILGEPCQVKMMPFGLCSILELKDGGQYMILLVNTAYLSSETVLAIKGISDVKS